MPIKLNPMQKIMAARAVIRAATPYYSSALLRIQFREVPPDVAAASGFATMGMTDAGVCYYLTSFVDGLSAAEIAAVLVHEMLHFLRQDGARFSALAAADESVQQLSNIACDVANNDDVVNGGWKLPGRPLRKDELEAEAHVEGIFWVPSSLGMPDGRTAAEYLAELRKRQQKKKGKGKDGKSGARVCDGQCGSVAGSANPVEGKMGLGKGKGGAPGKDEKGKGDGGGEGMTPAECERVRAQVAREVASHVQQKGRGSVPGGLARWADEQLLPPKIPWQTKLRRATRRAVQRCSGAQDFAWSRVSRRQGGIGYGAGLPRLPALVGNVPQVAVVVDTSGSMSQGQLVEGISETAGVLRAVGSGVSFCAIDSATEGVSRVRTWQEAARKLKGGGGTDMKPALALLEGSRTPPDVVVVITDGMIGDVGPKPKAHVIWLLVGSNYTKDVSKWGEVIVMDEEAGKAKGKGKGA